MVERIKSILMISMLLSCTDTAQEAEGFIKELMQRQESCWNRGDLECFMNGYWESDSLMFIGKDKIHLVIRIPSCDIRRHTQIRMPWAIYHSPLFIWSRRARIPFMSLANIISNVVWVIWKGILPFCGRRLMENG